MSTIPSQKDKEIKQYLGSNIIATKKQRFFGFMVTKIAFIGVIFLVIIFSKFLNVSVINSVTIAIIVIIKIHIALLFFKQKTVGMIINGTQIISDGSRDLSVGSLIFWRLLLNWILPFVPGIGLLAIFNYLNITGNNTNRCIHDELSNTVVIKAIDKSS